MVDFVCESLMINRTPYQKTPYFGEIISQYISTIVLNSKSGIICSQTDCSEIKSAIKTLAFDYDVQALIDFPDKFSILTQYQAGLE